MKAQTCVIKKAKNPVKATAQNSVKEKAQKIKTLL